MLYRIVNGSVSVRVDGGFKIRIIKEKVKPDLEPFRYRFFGFGTGTIYGTGLDLSPSLG